MITLLTTEWKKARMNPAKFGRLHKIQTEAEGVGKVTLIYELMGAGKYRFLCVEREDGGEYYTLPYNAVRREDSRNIYAADAQRRAHYS